MLEAGDEIVASDRNDQRPDCKFHVLRVILIVPEMNDRPSLQQRTTSRNSLTDSDACAARDDILISVERLVEREQHAAVLQDVAALDAFLP